MTEEQPELPGGDEVGGPDPASPAVPVHDAPSDQPATPVNPAANPSAYRWPAYPWPGMEDFLERQRAIADMAARASQVSAEARRAGEQTAAVIVGLAALGGMAVEALRARTAAASAGSAAPRYAEYAAQVERRTRRIREVAAAVGRGAKRVVTAAGKFAHDVYVAAAPPNWTEDPSVPTPDYAAAVALADDEGIPVAWVPDPDTVRQLLAVPATAPDRRTQLLAILDTRSQIILDYCQQRLDGLTPSSADQQHLADAAGQAITALRDGLTVPAQSAAADLVDVLVARWFAPTGRRLRYDQATRRITELGLRSTPITFTMLLSKVTLLREATTLLPVPMAFTSWWPQAGDPVPEVFSRHATTHALHSPRQVTPTNALIAIMLAVSLLCQEHASGWTAIRLYRQLTAPTTSQLPPPRSPAAPSSPERPSRSRVVRVPKRAVADMVPRRSVDDEHRAARQRTGRATAEASAPGLSPAHDQSSGPAEML